MSDIDRWLLEHEGLFRFEVLKPDKEPGGQQVGVRSYPFRLTHLPTGIQVIIPAEYSRSDLKRYDFAREMFATLIIMNDLNPITLQKQEQP